MLKKASDIINRFSRSRELYIMIYVIMGLLAAVSVFAGIRNALIFSQDFQYDAAKALLYGTDPYDVSLEGMKSPDVDGLSEFYSYYESIGAPQRMEANQFPSLLYLLAPWCFFSAKRARVLWLVSNLLFTGFIIVLLRHTFFKETDKKLFFIFVLLMIAGTPWRNQIGVGQHTLFSVMFFLLAVYLSEEKRMPVPAGIALAVSYFKYTVTAPLAVYFIYKRRWKELIISVIPHIAGTAIAAVSLKGSFPDMIIKPLKVASSLSGEGSMDIGAIMGGGIACVVVTVLLMLFLIAAGFICPKGNDRLIISLCVLLSLIMTYHRLYDFFIMIFVFAYFDEREGGSPAAEIFYLLTCFDVFFIPRLLHESEAGLIIAGVPYYLFTVYILIAVAEKIRNKGGGIYG
ncbi:MAG: DUF2029 domain-containing protein [Lachnospiraceae bacterium]|nr:DUF2029 domain-containing protein [Lachnospiraceae bacterium]